MSAGPEQIEIQVQNNGTRTRVNPEFVPQPPSVPPTNVGSRVTKNRNQGLRIVAPPPLSQPQGERRGEALIAYSQRPNIDTVDRKDIPSRLYNWGSRRALNLERLRKKAGRAAGVVAGGTLAGTRLAGRGLVAGARGTLAGALGTVKAVREGVAEIRRRPGRVHPNGGANSTNTNTGVANSTNRNTGAAARRRVANARERTARQRANAQRTNQFLQNSVEAARLQKAKNENEVRVLAAQKALAKTEAEAASNALAKAQKLLITGSTNTGRPANNEASIATVHRQLNNAAAIMQRLKTGRPANNGSAGPVNTGRPANNGGAGPVNNGNTNNGRSNNRNQNLSGFNLRVTDSSRGRLRKTQGYARLLADLISVYPKYASGRVNASNEAILNRVRITGYRKATFNRVRSLVGTADGGEVTEAIAQVIDNIKDDGLVQYVVPLTKQILRAKKMSRMNP